MFRTVTLKWTWNWKKFNRGTKKSISISQPIYNVESLTASRVATRKYVSKSKPARFTCTCIWKINRAINSLLPQLETWTTLLETQSTRLETRMTRLETRYSKYSSFEDLVELFEFQVTVNLHLTGTVPIVSLYKRWTIVEYMWNVCG